MGEGIHKVDLFFVDNSTPNRFLKNQDIEMTMEWDIDEDDIDKGTLLGDSSGCAYCEHDFQLFEFKNMATEEYIDTKVNPRISAYVDYDETLSQSEKIVDFNAVEYNTGITVVDGVFTISEDGFYVGSMESFIFEYGNPYIAIWIECLLSGESVWGICGGGIKVYVPTDTGSSYPFNGGFLFHAGDKVRIKAKILTPDDTAKFQAQSFSSSLGTVVQRAASITFYKEGNL